MDFDRQISQLQEFDQQALLQPDNAHIYATKGFLECLYDLIQRGLEKEGEDDGSDAYKEELKIFKSSIRALSTVLPIVYKTICQNEAESQLWELTRSLMTIVETELVKHRNTGVKIVTIKCLQVIVILLSNTSYLRADHRLLKSEELEKEAKDQFNYLVELMKSDAESILTAAVSCLTLIAKKRPQFIKPVIEAFTTWKKTHTKEESPVTYRNVLKAIRVALTTLIRTESLSPHHPELITAFGAVGGNTAIFRKDQRSEEASRRKRAASQQQQQDSDRADKRAKTSTSQTEYIVPLISQENILANYDITRIPLHHMVQLCMTVLQNVPIETMSERLQVLPPEGVTLAANRPGFISGSSTPPYPPPYDHPKYIKDHRIKREEDITAEQASKGRSTKEETVSRPEGLPDLDEDEEMADAVRSKDANLRAKIAKEEEQLMRLKEEESKPKVELLASVEERASQALKLKPYELESQQNILGDVEKRDLIKMSVDRILQAGALFDTNLVLNSTNVKSVWLKLVSKLLTKGTNMADLLDDMPEEEQTDDAAAMEDDKNAIVIHNDAYDDINSQLKESLITFIAEDLTQRLDLALEWLHEEYLYDKRHLRKTTSNSDNRRKDYTPSYFKWFHKLLEKCIPKLDAKDRTLTKLMLEAPDVDAIVIDMIKDNLENVPERFVSCVSTLRNLAINRPTVRYVALDVLLNLCTNQDDKKRRTSIVAVKKWDDNQSELFERVEKFSVESLHKLCDSRPERQQSDINGNMAVPEDSTLTVSETAAPATEESKAESTNNEGSLDSTHAMEVDNTTGAETTTTSSDDDWSEKDVVRFAELFFVLCTRRPVLLKELFDVYIKASDKVKSSIKLHIVNMIKSIGMRSQDLVSLVREFPVGGESLVIRILSILCESKPPTREIVTTVQSISTLATERTIDISSIAPILSGKSLSSAQQQPKQTGGSTQK